MHPLKSARIITVGMFLGFLIIKNVNRVIINPTYPAVESIAIIAIPIITVAMDDAADILELLLPNDNDKAKEKAIIK